MEHVTQELKKCSKCKVPKPLDDYFRRGDGSGKPRPQCKLCSYVQGASYKRRHPESRRRYNNQRYQHKLLVCYGLTADAYAELLRQQEGACAICKLSPKRKKLAVDHDHASGMVRGLLCDRCNRAVGLFGDSVLILQQAVAYLSRVS
jgi:hypothetical protein